MSNNDLLDAARSLYIALDANASIDPDQPVPHGSYDVMVEAGLHGALVPHAAGGAELAMVDALDVFTEISRADGSTGWCLMASVTTAAFFGAWGTDELVEKMFAGGVPLCAGQFAPNGTAERDGDDWMVNGSYQFGSGIDVAQWVGAGAFATEGDSEPDMVFLTFPAEDAERTGNWNVMGLRATASEDYVLRDLRVPVSSSFRFLAPVRRRGGPIFELGVLGLTTIGHIGFAQGVVRRALDELTSLAATKHRMGAAVALRDSERFLHELGRLQARAQADAAYARSELERAQALLEANPAPDSALTNRLRAACVHITQNGADIVREAYLLGGTTALRAGPLERCMRDIHAGTQHFFASPAGAIDFGRDILDETGG